MNFGFNSNVRALGAVYHVQSEDRGASHPYLDTVVYETGRVVFKRSSSYKDFLATASKDTDFAEQLHERLAQQHREVIGQLETGTLTLAGNTKTETEASAPVPASTPSDGLDVRLMNPKTWLAPGSVTSHVTLDIELRRRNSEQTVGEAEVEALLEHEKERVHCQVAHTDSAGRATLKFTLPPAAADGSALVIRATDGSLYGELRFRLKATRPVTAALK